MYETVKGWNTDLTNIRLASEIPAPLAEYITFIEKAVGLPVDLVSIGPDRVQTIRTESL